MNTLNLLNSYYNRIDKYILKLCKNQQLTNLKYCFYLNFEYRYVKRNHKTLKTIVSK
jgi:hypothetical protein